MIYEEPSFWQTIFFVSNNKKNQENQATRFSWFWCL